MRSLFTVLLFFICHKGIGQAGYHIVYHTVYKYPNAIPSFIKEMPTKMQVVFNDSFFYSYPTTNGKPNATKQGIYGLKLLPHSSYYSVKENQYYDLVWRQNKRKIRLKKVEPLPIEWRILKDSVKNILGHSCTKAWGLNKDKVVYIWFTNDIPFPYGPGFGYPFPGLVLEYDYLYYGKIYVASKITKGNFEIAIPNLKIIEPQILPH